MFERAPVNHQSLPTATALERVRRQMALSADAQDVYLAYEGAPQLGLSGLLVSMRGDIDQIVAYCPLSKATPPCTPAWRDEVRRQRRWPRAARVRLGCPHEAPSTGTATVASVHTSFA